MHLIMKKRATKHKWYECVVQSSAQLMAGIVRTKQLSAFIWMMNSSVKYCKYHINNELLIPCVRTIVRQWRNPSNKSGLKSTTILSFGHWGLSGRWRGTTGVVGRHSSTVSLFVGRTSPKGWERQRKLWDRETQIGVIVGVDSNRLRRWAHIQLSVALALILDSNWVQTVAVVNTRRQTHSQTHRTHNGRSARL